MIKTRAEMCVDTYLVFINQFPVYLLFIEGFSFVSFVYSVITWNWSKRECNKKLYNDNELNNSQHIIGIHE